MLLVLALDLTTPTLLSLALDVRGGYSIYRMGVKFGEEFNWRMIRRTTKIKSAPLWVNSGRSAENNLVPVIEQMIMPFL